MKPRLLHCRLVLLVGIAVGTSAGLIERSAIGSTPADMIVVDAVVITVDDALPQVEAFAVRAGRIAEVGNSETIRRLAGTDTVTIEGRGRTITPGFIDAHCHPRPQFPVESPFGEVACGPAACKSIDDVIRALRAKAAITPAGQWVMGRGYQDTKLGRHLTRHDLDQASTRHPIYVGHSSGHVAAVNSLALITAKVSRETPDPRGGQFDRDKDGEPTGVLRERAKGIVLDAGPERPEPSEREYVEGLRRCFAEFVAKGITSVHVAGTSLESTKRLRRAVSLGGAPRIYAMLRESDAIEAFEQTEGRGELSRSDDEWLKLGAVKLFHGNSLSGQTCWLYEPYALRPNYYGIPPARSQESLDELIFRCHKAGLQCCVHSNGDREIDMVLNAFEKALDRMPRSDHRHRIEHGSVVNQRILERIKRLGVVLAPHSYIYEHGDKMEAYGPERWDWMHPFGSAVRMGIPIAGNSDSPVSAADPLLQIESMVTRRSAEGKVYGPAQRISVQEALRAWTLGGAFASFDERVKGSITKGKLADFVMLSADPRVTSNEQLKDIAVVLTVIGGQIAYQNESSRIHDR
jgi:predicted amidohydrolase YtcJ